jgi:hypothetical protein
MRPFIASVSPLLAPLVFSTKASGSSGGAVSARIPRDGAALSPCMADVLQNAQLWLLGQAPGLRTRTNSVSIPVVLRMPTALAAGKP